ncbi:hypothetical protein GYMLUDRAFT_228322 [Collybiopsis luxurians FD-317 M1]|uniref:Nephrocystin 3-like N-terminal domain-containing protein n=1 Tax=Collybiopsis luxurians FD-317 M1 TaxID=944289 RepID=A0A0D0B471_9AGAR|nr:hypothetical protein GYMLUDRAFT_228322 [Collybiopsis luxurians FD-317 M1]
MFNGSHNFAIHGGTFNSAGGDVHIYEERGERGLATLYHHTSTSASYDAGARYPPPLCHPGTRQAILQDLGYWANRAAGAHNPPIRWLYGPAGAGKSAIAQSFAQTCAENGSLLGSFFFWRSDPSRNNPQCLFTTIAMQMAIAIPELRTIMDTAVIQNPFAPTSFIEKQCDALIIKPWLDLQVMVQIKARIHSELRQRWNNMPNVHRNLVPESPQWPSSVRARILILDGLDECCNENNEWQRILSNLALLCQKFNLLVRILVCSRPEPRIKECFAGSGYQNICQWMALNDTYQASNDIRLFLVDGFQKILIHHSHSMEHIPRPWPALEQIEYLVHKSSGQFIYPSTVLKYINEDGDVPADRLNVILGLEAADHGEEDSPYADLDALYLQILSKVKKRALFLKVLAARLAYFGSPDLLIQLLGIPVGTLHATFSGVHALFQDPSPIGSDLQFAHASFPSFLVDHNRSLHFHIDISIGHDFLAQRCLESYSDLLGFRDDYTRERWANHCALASGSDKLMAMLDSLPVYAAITRAMPYGDHPDWRSYLANLLYLILQIRYKFKDKCGQQLQHIRDIVTVGFSVVLVLKRPLDFVEEERYTIYVQYPSHLSSALASGSLHDGFQVLMNYLDSQIAQIPQRSFRPRHTLPLDISARHIGLGLTKGLFFVEFCPLPYNWYLLY